LRKCVFKRYIAVIVMRCAIYRVLQLTLISNASFQFYIYFYHLKSIYGMDYKCLKNFESLAEFTEVEEICESNNATINSIN
jgi:hypothetical protein